MSDVDILNHYGLQSLDPRRWPEGLFEEAEQEANENQWTTTQRARKRMTTLGRAPSLPSNSKKSQKASVQKDEVDPLGNSQSVVQALKYRGLPVDDDIKLRNTFLLSSITFNPSRYLAEVHSDASTDDLMRGLDHLSSSIEQKSASLKVLVESNFERFLRAKATIDNVYKEMRDHGAEPEEPLRKPHSRQTSRNKPHFRSFSGNAPSSPQSPQGRTAAMSEKRRYALAKETEYGTLGVRMPLLEAQIKADEIWGPAMGDKGKEEELKAVLESMERHRDLFEHASTIDECIRRNDYEDLTAGYGRMEYHASEARAVGERAQQTGRKLSDAELHQVILTARIWMDVQTKTEDVKRRLWSKLLSSHDSRLGGVTSKADEPLEIMSVLLQLGVNDSPIAAWLRSHQEHLQFKITSTFERARVELEIMRRRLLKNGKPTARALAIHLRTSSKAKKDESHIDIDSQQVLHYWQKVESSLENFLSTRSGVLGEVLEFWDTAQGFIDGKKQRNLPSSGSAQRHLRLSSEDVSNLQQAPAKLCGMIRDQLHRFFLQDPVEDVSSLFSPIPPTPNSPQTPGAAMTPSRLTKFNFRPEDVPPPSPRIGESWENLPFWAPYSNSLSASTTLGRLLSKVAISAGDMATITSIRQDDNQISAFRILISDVRERFNTATCAAWVADSESCRELEDWSKAAERTDVTNMPFYFSAWESTMLTNAQKIVYISEAGSNSIIVPPSARHVETVQRALRNSLYKAFDGIMQAARKPVAAPDGVDVTTSSLSSTESSNSLDRSFASGHPTAVLNANTRKLLTISNFQYLRSTVVPQLVSLFESHFSTTITNDARVLRESLSQMSSQVFKAYVKPTMQNIDQLIQNGISDPNYASSIPGQKPNNAKPYVYDVLGSLVVLHTEISNTTPTLTGQVLSHCLEHVSQTLIEAFTKKPGKSHMSFSTAVCNDIEIPAALSRISPPL